MQVRFRLSQILDEYKDSGRGRIKRLVEHTGLERHQVSAMLGNRIQYLSLDALAKVCGYLIVVHNVDPSQLPGRLFALEPGEFWSLLADQQTLWVCFGVRGDMPKSKLNWWVSAPDSYLLGVLLHELFGIAQAKLSDHPQGLDQILVSAYKTTHNEKESEQEAIRAKNEAEAVYKNFNSIGGERALICLGSIKSNVVVELAMAKAFKTKSFKSQDDVSKPQERDCPIFFRFREQDPHPPSCYGGLQLAKRRKTKSHCESDVPGIYYEKKDGQWECCPWSEEEDAAIVFYSYHPPEGVLEVVMGGFSSRATHCLAKALREISSKLWPPIYKTDRHQVGAFVIRFEFQESAKQPSAKHDPLYMLESSYVPRASKTVVDVVPYEVLARRLD